MILSFINNLKIQYIAAEQLTWSDQLPESGWILLAIADAAAQVPDKALAVCLHHCPAGISCAGLQAATLEDNFDMEIVLQALDWEEKHQRPFDYGYAPVTTADADLAEALWFSIMLAPNIATEAVDTVVCLDFTCQQESRLREMVELLATGWLPPDASE